MRMLCKTGLAGLGAFALAAAVRAAEESAAGKAPLISTGLMFGIAFVMAVVGLVFAFLFYKDMMKASEGTEKMREIASAVREGAYAYLYAQYRTVGKVFVALFVIFLVLAWLGIQNPFVPIAFLTGGFFSGLCGFLGMKTATNASARTAQGASESLNRGLQVAFRSGAVMGLVVVGFGLLDICLWYWILDSLVYTAEHMRGGFGNLFGEVWLVKPDTPSAQKFVEITTTMITFGMGASTQALFARVGGGIYTKAADVGADLVGKVEAGIPEDDPRNPATIADNVGDNVGDVAGMGADLYESYCGSILATAALGAAIPALTASIDADSQRGVSFVLAPMCVAGLGILLSILGVYLVRCEEKATMKTLLKALAFGVNTSAGLIVVACAALALLNVITWGIFGSILAGLAAGIVIGQSTEYYTSDEYGPTQGIVDQCKTGPATCIIAGLGVGMKSSAVPVVTTVLAILLAYGFAGGFGGDSTAMAKGLYGISFAAVGMLATLGITLATDAYGPIADNAGGNAEMAGLGAQVRERTDSLDMLGNTTAATGKGFAIGSAALTAMALLAAFIEEVRIWAIKIGHTAEGALKGTYTPSGSGYTLFNPAEYKPAVQAADQFAVHFKSGMGAMDAWSKAGLDTQPLLGGKATTLIDATKASVGDFMQVYDITLINPKVLCGLFLGAMMVLVICALTMQAVGRAAQAMVEEVRRQFREIAGIMEYKAKPDYARCVEISTKGAQREMLVPSLSAIIVPVVVGVALGVPGVMGLLAGSLAAGFSVACLLNNAGGAWDNAKKHLEKTGKKKTDPHKAAVVGDTVGDPCKDTSGPSLNILLKLMSMVCVVFSGLIVKYGDLIIPWFNSLFD